MKIAVCYAPHLNPLSRGRGSNLSPSLLRERGRVRGKSGLQSNTVNRCLAIGTFSIFYPVFDNTKSEPLNQEVVAFVAESVFPSLTRNIAFIDIA
jgi:hypothetical protein